MSRGIPAGRIFGVPLRIGYSWLVVVPLVGLGFFAGIPVELGSPGIRIAVAAVATVLVSLSVIVHEAGHVWVARRRGVPVARTTVFLVGGVSEMDLDRVDPDAEMWVAAGGPLASGVLAIVLGIAMVVAPTVGGVQHVLAMLTVINAAVAAFNLLPGMPLDGGRVVRGLLRSIGWSDARAEWTTRWIGVGTGAMVLIVGTFAVRAGRPQAVILVPAGALLLLLGVAMRPERVVRVGEVMVPVPTPVAATDPIAGLPDGGVPIPVTAGGRLVGLVTAGGLRGLAGELMQTVLPGDMVGVRLPVAEAAARRAAGRTLLVVDDHGRLLGLLPSTKET